MVVLRQSPWYQEILQEGEQKEAQSLILRQIKRLIGPITSSLESQIQSLPFPQLEMLGEELLDFAEVSDLSNWLRSHS